MLLVVAIIALAAALVLPRLGPVARGIGIRSANYDLLSVGPDGQEGTDDDIGNTIRR